MPPLSRCVGDLYFLFVEANQFIVMHGWLSIGINFCCFSVFSLTIWQLLSAVAYLICWNIRLLFMKLIFFAGWYVLIWDFHREQAWNHWVHGAQSHDHGLSKDYTEHKAMVMVSAKIAWRTKPWSWSQQTLHGAQSHSHGFSKDYTEHKAMVMVSARITWSTKPSSWSQQRLHGVQTRGHGLNKDE